MELLSYLILIVIASLVALFGKKVFTTVLLLRIRRVINLIDANIVQSSNSNNENNNILKYIMQSSPNNSHDANVDEKTALAVRSIPPLTTNLILMV